MTPPSSQLEAVDTRSRGVVAATVAQHVLSLQHGAQGHPAPLLFRPKYARAGDQQAAEGRRGHLCRQLLHHLYHGHVRHFRGSDSAGQWAGRVHGRVSSGRLAAVQGRDGEAAALRTLREKEVADDGKVDAVVYSINPQGFFAQAGPLRLFVSAHVRTFGPVASP